MNKLLESLDPYTTEVLERKPMKFRNYAPRSKELSEFIIQAPTTVAEVEMTIEQDVIKTLKEFEQQQKEPLTIVPRKANWDLKRNIERKLEKTNKKTQEAISKLVRIQKNK